MLRSYSSPFDIRRDHFCRTTERPLCRLFRSAIQTSDISPTRSRGRSEQDDSSPRFPRTRRVQVLLCELTLRGLSRGGTLPRGCVSTANDRRCHYPCRFLSGLTQLLTNFELGGFYQANANARRSVTGVRSRTVRSPRATVALPARQAPAQFRNRSRGEFQQTLRDTIYQLGRLRRISSETTASPIVYTSLVRHVSVETDEDGKMERLYLALRFGVHSTRGGPVVSCASREQDCALAERAFKICMTCQHSPPPDLCACLYHRANTPQLLVGTDSESCSELSPICGATGN